MRLDLEQNTRSIPFVEKTAPNSENTNELRELLRDGIKAANAGNRSQARTSLLRATEMDPKNETAWLWLASISEFPEELLAFLSRVLEINPENERALEWAAATRSLLSKTFVQRGIDAFEESQNDFATQCFTQALAYDEQNQMAWLWMASLSDSNDGKIAYLEKVLHIDPANEAAIAAYKEARDENTKGLLREAQAAAVAGNSAEAKRMLTAILEEMPDSEEAWTLNALFVDTFEEKVASYERILSINPANMAAVAGLESLRSIMALAAPPAQSIPEQPTEDVPVESATRGSVSENYEMSSDEDPELDRSPTQDLVFPVAALQDSSFEVEDLSENGTDAEMHELSHDPEAVAKPELNFAPEPVAEPEPEFATQLAAENIEAVEENIEAVVEMPADDAELHATVADEDQDALNAGDAAEEYFADQGIRETLVDPQPDEAYFYYETPPETTPEVFETKDDTVVEEPAELSSDPFGSTVVENYVPAVSAEYSDLMATVAEVEAEAEAEIVEDPALPESAFDSGIPMPAGMLEALDNGSAEDAFKTMIVERTDSATAPCPFCSASNEPQAFVCQSCMAMLTLSDLEMLLANQHADKVMVREAVEEMERQRSTRDFNENELTILGIGHLNLRNFQFGYDCLALASQLNPNNVVLNGQVHALLIRLDEIKQHEEAHTAMVKGRAILVVDDSPTVRKLIAGKLEKSGHEVFCAEDGVAAMSQLETVVPDLVLLDITMPRMDGYEVCKRIRSNDKTKDVPVVMISGKDGFFDKVRGRMAGTSGYITKPFGPETLMKAVETYLKADA